MFELCQINTVNNIVKFLSNNRFFMTLKVQQIALFRGLQNYNQSRYFYTRIVFFLNLNNDLYSLKNINSKNIPEIM